MEIVAHRSLISRLTSKTHRVCTTYFCISQSIFSLGHDYIIELKFIQTANLCLALKRFMRIFPVTCSEGSFREKRLSSSVSLMLNISSKNCFADRRIYFWNFMIVIIVFNYFQIILHRIEAKIKFKNTVRHIIFTLYLTYSFICSQFKLVLLSRSWISSNWHIIFRSILGMGCWLPATFLHRSIYY